jgi:hypothetical protein
LKVNLLFQYFQNFLAFVKGKHPQTILTDQDLALKEAIATELPNIKHAFCIWHIVAKLSSWFSFQLGARYNDFKCQFYRVYHLDCEDDFEQEWQSMVAQFGLSNDRHIDLLYSLRQMLGSSLFEGLLFCWDDNNWTFGINKFIYKTLLGCQNKFDRFY